MGGKNKQSQRTKNNVRPSSSGRSAELLSGSGKFDVGMAAVGGKMMPALFPTLATVPLDAGLDPELAMCIKKLNKKDHITKTKALQELTELVNKSRVEDIEAILPSWSHFYRMLSVDMDCKVRECTQVCHGAIVRVCGRRIAPQLKQLLPAWLQAQYDDHAPAMTQAQLSLKNTFPDAKLPEVIAFCKTEILDFLEDNLTGQAAAGEGARGAAAALHGLAWSARHAPGALHDWLGARLARVLASDAFWKLAAHSDANVRAAWFGALGSVVARCGGLPDAKLGPRLLRALLGAREAEPRAAAQMWGCLLLCMHHVPDWHTWLDKRDLLTKRILNLLETGGWGDARQLASSLLPLLAGLPPDMLTTHFYEQFFDAIFKGLEKKSVVNSKSERQAWLTGLAECVRYASRGAGAAGAVGAALRRWLRAALAPRAAPLLRHSAAAMAGLLNYWMRKAGEEDGDRYSALVRNFWQNVCASVCAPAGEGAPADAAAAHVALLNALRTSFTQEPRKERSIRFDGDEPAEAEPSPPVAPLDSASLELFQHQLSAAAEQVCAHYLEVARDARSPSALLPAIAPLFTSLSRPAVQAVASRLDAPSIYGLVDKLLLPWLRDEDTRCEPVVDLVFQLLTHLSEEEQDAVFATFTQEAACLWCLRRALSHPAVRLPAARRWLRGQHAARLVLSAARGGAGAGPRELLLRALTPADDDEMLVSEETVCQVVDILVESLSSACSDALCALVSQLTSSLAQRAPRNYDTLLLTLFSLTLTQERAGGQVSCSSWVEARSAWQDGLLASSDDARTSLRARAAALLAQKALSNNTNEDIDISTIEHAASLCPYLLSECEQPEPTCTAEVVELLEQLSEAARAHAAGHANLDTYALRHDVIAGRLSCPFPDDNEHIARVVNGQDDDELTREDLVGRLGALLLPALGLRALLRHGAWAARLLAAPAVRAACCRLLRDCQPVYSLHHGYAFWPHYEIIQRVKSKLDVVLQDIISVTPPQMRQNILLSLSSHAAKEGYYWAYARAHYEAQITRREEDQSTDQSVEGVPSVDLDNLADVITGNGLYHSLQANLYWLPSPPIPPTEEGDGVGPPSPSLRTAHAVMVRAAMAALEAEHAPQDIRDQFATDAAAVRDASPDLMVDLYYKFENVMLGDRDPLRVPWATVCCSAAAAEYLSRLVAQRGWLAAAHHWDFATISLCALLAALQRPLGTRTALLCESSLRLLHEVRSFAGSLREQCVRREPTPHVAALMDEWRDIFAPDIYSNLFTVIMRELESPPAGPISCPRARFLSSLCVAARALQWAALPAALRLERLSLQRVARRCSAALAAQTHRAYKYLAHATLRAIAEDLVLEDAEKLAALSSDSSEEEPQQLPPLSPRYVHDHYRTLLELLDAALAHIPLTAPPGHPDHSLPPFSVGEASCEMAAGSDGRGVALGALLLCDALHAACARARGDLAHHYIQIFREEKYTDLLLPCAARLLPAEALAAARGLAWPAALQDLFSGARFYSVDEPESSCRGVGDVSALACRALWHALAGPGQAAARAAWAAWPARAARPLADLAARAVAPQLLREQFQQAASKAKTLADTELTLMLSAREAHVVYTVDDQQLRMTVTYSAEHPLCPPRVSTPAAGPGAGAHWLEVFLGYQGGQLLQAARLWVGALGARVERALPCYICYCRLHPQEGVLPKRFCVQCKNKFHKTCIRKWFTTSKKSNCPVCRAMF